MNYKEQTKEVVEKIKKQEEERYGIKLNIETPTTIEYYVDNFKKGNFKLSKDNFNNAVYTFIYGLQSGLAHSSTGDIMVRSVDHNLRKLLNHPVLYLTKNLDWQEIQTAFLTYHEIRHVLQWQSIDMSDYDAFCYWFLDNYKMRAYVDREYHDSLYREIDADLYAVFRCQEMFSENKEALDYFEEVKKDVIRRKVLYDFDYNFEEYNRMRFTGKLDEYKKNTEGTIFKEFYDGDDRFNTPSKILNIKSNSADEDGNVIIGYVDMKILTSESYLSRLDIDNLTEEELAFMQNTMKYLEKELDDKKQLMNDFLESSKQRKYKNTIKTLDLVSARKESYKIKFQEKLETFGVELEKGSSR